MAIATVARGINTRGPCLSASLPISGEISPEVQVPRVTARAMVLRLQPVSSKMKSWMPPSTTCVMPVHVKVARAAMPIIIQP